MLCSVERETTRVVLCREGNHTYCVVCIEGNHTCCVVFRGKPHVFCYVENEITCVVMCLDYTAAIINVNII